MRCEIERTFLIVAAALLAAHPGFGETPAATPPVRFVGQGLIDFKQPDGALRPVVGVQNFQILRASREHPELGGDGGWTYHHAPMLAYWQGRFWMEILANPRDEHGYPTRAFLMSSPDGRRWSAPEVAFPEWDPSGGGNVPRFLIHHRMAFYLAPNGRLLVSTHYGTPEHTFAGPGHVVREIHADGSLGPIYFIQYGAGWNESNAFYPYYTSAKDAGFLEACAALRANRLMMDQWFELQEGYPEGAYTAINVPYSPRESRRSLAFYHRKDGVAVGVWKKAWTALSFDDGRTWSNLSQAPGVAKTFAKVWGQRTEDGRYALAWDPQDHPPGNRWPLAIATGEDGSTYSDMLVVHGEVPQRRYPGKAKDIGPQYVRGILEGNGDPPGTDLWLAYSVSKEDIWICRMPVPITGRVEQAVADDFEKDAIGEPPAGWNVYSPKWAPVSVTRVPDSHNRCIELCDADPFDYARAVRVFPESRTTALEFRVMARRGGAGRLEIDVADARGRRPVRLCWSEDGSIQAVTGKRVRDFQRIELDRWTAVRLEIDVGSKTYRLSLNDQMVVEKGEFAEAVDSVERLSFRTGEVRGINWDQAGPQDPVDGPPDEIKYFTGAVEPGTDHPIPAAIFCVDDVRTFGKR